jgi:hypothetical protein
LHMRERTPNRSMFKMDFEIMDMGKQLWRTGDRLGQGLKGLKKFNWWNLPT